MDDREIYIQLDMRQEQKAKRRGMYECVDEIVATSITITEHRTWIKVIALLGLGDSTLREGGRVVELCLHSVCACKHAHWLKHLRRPQIKLPSTYIRICYTSHST